MEPFLQEPSSEHRNIRKEHKKTPISNLHLHSVGLISGLTLLHFPIHPHFTNIFCYGSCSTVCSVLYRYSSEHCLCASQCQYLLYKCRAHGCHIICSSYSPAKIAGLGAHSYFIVLIWTQGLEEAVAVWQGATPEPPLSLWQGARLSDP